MPVLEARVVPGLCFAEAAPIDDDENSGFAKLTLKRHGEFAYTDALSNPAAGLTYGIVTAPDILGYQFLQARGIILLNNPDVGLVTLLPISMAEVSFVVISENIKVGKWTEKGEKTSYL